MTLDLSTEYIYDQIEYYAPGIDRGDALSLYISNGNNLKRTIQSIIEKQQQQQQQQEEDEAKEQQRQFQRRQRHQPQITGNSSHISGNRSINNNFGGFFAGSFQYKNKRHIYKNKRNIYKNKKNYYSDHDSSQKNVNNNNYRGHGDVIFEIKADLMENMNNMKIFNLKLLKLLYIISESPWIHPQIYTISDMVQNIKKNIDKKLLLISLLMKSLVQYLKFADNKQFKNGRPTKGKVSYVWKIHRAIKKIDNKYIRSVEAKLQHALNANYISKKLTIDDVKDLGIIFDIEPLAVTETLKDLSNNTKNIYMSDLTRFTHIISKETDIINKIAKQHVIFFFFFLRFI